jgi:hypothetical protein
MAMVVLSSRIWAMVRMVAMYRKRIINSLSGYPPLPLQVKNR